MKKAKIARIVTVPFTLISLRGLFGELLNDERFELHVISGKDDFLETLKKEYPEIKYHFVDIPRKISLKRDIQALSNLMYLYIKENFQIVHSHTPKAGLLSAIAGFLTLRPVRIHTFTGQVWANYKGHKRNFFIVIDKLISGLNTVNYVDSHGQKQFLIENHIGSDSSLKVLHMGSIAGIDLTKFSWDRVKDQSLKLRAELFPGFDGKIILYLGRINNDKGLKELGEAYLELKKTNNIRLLIVGPSEPIEPELEILINKLRNDPGCLFIGFVSNTEEYYGLCDIYCLPSYREGCPTSILEASVMKKGVVATNIYGIKDIVIEGKTAYLFESHNSKDLYEKLNLLINDQYELNQMGEAGKKFVEENFSQNLLTSKLIDDYVTFIGKLL